MCVLPAGEFALSLAAFTVLKDFWEVCNCEMSLNIRARPQTM